jgi:hypothetical protein
MIDLSPYKAGSDRQLGYEPLAVGWLQRNKAFPTGKSSVEFQEKLLAFCFEEHTVNQARALSRCAVGDNCPRLLPPVKSEGQTAHFGSSEIRVIGENEIYAAPTLIYHYVTAHDYRPPNEFIAAVITGPPAGSPEHRALIKTLNRR